MYEVKIIKLFKKYNILLSGKQFFFKNVRFFEKKIK